MTRRLKDALREFVGAVHSAMIELDHSVLDEVMALQYALEDEPEEPESDHHTYHCGVTLTDGPCVSCGHDKSDPIHGPKPSVSENVTVAPSDELYPMYVLGKALLLFGTLPPDQRAFTFHRLQTLLAIYGAIPIRAETLVRHENHERSV